MNHFPIINSDTGLTQYLHKINLFPLLSEAEEGEAINNWIVKKCVKAAHLLVVSHLRLVVKIAMRFKYYGLPIMDLVSEGNIGLMHAVKKFSPEKGCRLATYAMWWIRAFIQDYILKSWSLVKIGTTAVQKKLFYGLGKTKRKIMGMSDFKNISHLQMSQTIADIMGVDVKEAQEMQTRLSNGDCSINRLVDCSSNIEMADNLPDMRDNQETKYIVKNDTSYKKKLISQAFAILSTREKQIFRDRNLVSPPLTLQRISEKFNISKERVRQIDNNTIQKMRSFVAKLSAKA